jgi:hypothetical protein
MIRLIGNNHNHCLNDFFQFSMCSLRCLICCVVDTMRGDCPLGEGRSFFVQPHHEVSVYFAKFSWVKAKRSKIS